MHAKITLAITANDCEVDRIVSWDELSPAFRIGRAKDSDLFLNEPTLSRKHCELVAKEESLYVRDLESSKGTLLNGEPISFELINDGDELRLGLVKIVVHFEGGRGPVGEAPLDEKTPAKHSASGNDGERTLVGDSRSQSSRHVTIPVDRDELIVGRDRSACDFRLDDLNVSREHFRLSRKRNKVWIEDLQSRNGTYVNGESIEEPVELREGDTVDAGAHHFVYDGNALISGNSGQGIAITTHNLAVRNLRPRPGQPEWFLKDVSISVQSGQFIGVLGASGGGKSTFMQAVSGRAATGIGEIIYDGLSFTRHADAFRASIGYGPQENIFHQDLTVEDALRFTSRLRLSRDASRDEIEQNIERVLNLVELTERRKTIIRNLSGGQKRRVVIAMELLGNPRVLFLDEVTSGLDRYLERLMMELFAQLVNEQGITVFVITHSPNNCDLCDKVMYLKAGQLIFFGKPEAAKEFFGVRDLEGIEETQRTRSADEWREKFEGTSEFEEMAESIETTPSRPDAPGSEKLQSSPADWPSVLNQSKILVERYTRVFVADRLNMLVFILGPLVAWLLCLITRSQPTTDMRTYVANQFTLCVGSTLIVYFLGIFSSVREIVKEGDVYLHERFTTVDILPYFISKCGPLAFIGVIQCFAVTYVIIHYGGISLKEADHWLMGTLLVTYLAAMLTGLAISAASLKVDSRSKEEATKSDTAVVAMLFILIPQVLFGGALTGGAGAKGTAETIAKYLITNYWSLEATKALIADYQNTSVNKLLVSAGLEASLWRLGLHCLFFATLTVVLLVVKEGPGASRSWGRIIATITGRRSV